MLLDSGRRPLILALAAATAAAVPVPLSAAAAPGMELGDDDYLSLIACDLVRGDMEWSLDALLITVGEP
jgi:hypothetical protein